MNDMRTAGPAEENVLLKAFESMVGQPLLLDDRVLKEEYEKAMEKGENDKTVAAVAAHSAPLTALATFSFATDEAWSCLYRASAFGEA